MTEKQSPDLPEHDGLFITKGMLLSIPPGGLVVSVNGDGTPAMSIQALHVKLNMCPRWISIAYGHVVAAEAAHTELIAAYRAGDHESMALALERESAAGMQAVAASCTAMDAYYASFREHTFIEQATIVAWRKNRLARGDRIAEVLRRTFKMTPQDFQATSGVLKQAYDLRDRAVHPTTDMAPPVVYAEIRQATEWRLVFFRAENARIVTGQFLNIITQSTTLPVHNPTPALTDLLSSTSVLCEPTLQAWEARYGQFRRPANSSGT
jgi:hypothetical protein